MGGSAHAGLLDHVPGVMSEDETWDMILSGDEVTPAAPRRFSYYRRWSAEDRVREQSRALAKFS
jgi:hypothetical protein